jgi:response regulator of citrate/malate metabolism
MIRTLVIDDDFRVANLHAAYLRRAPGFEVTGIARTGAEAQQLIAQSRPDLVLLDLYLPDGNGLDVVAAARAAGHQSLEFVVITAARDADAVRSAMRLGAVHYLVKPFPYELLCERLQSYLAMRQRRDALREFNQRQIDAVFAAVRPPVALHGRYSGRAPRTAHAVESLVGEAPTGLTAFEVAEQMGLSRATAQRYLSQLAERGRATIELRYRPHGRPEHVYRLTGRHRGAVAAAR